MKQLELNLNKRLLVVEYETQEEEEMELLTHNAFESDKKAICKGLELTEEIAKKLAHQSIHTGLFAHYVKDIPVNTYCYKSALESFISAIEAAGYYWGENPIEKPLVFEGKFSEYRKIINEYVEAESCTFNPEKTLIFEIL